MGELVQPIILYTLCLLGGGAVLLALPRGGKTPQIVGAALASLVGGAAFIYLGSRSPEHIPNVYFYVFSLIGAGGALRVITHPRPVYAALYFILTVISTGGLFVLLSAEFMAFALIIVYAGAILITYLFVIMLATQAPDETHSEVLADYDTSAKEPAAATVAGFLLLALLTTLVFRGTDRLPTPADPTGGEAVAASMPLKMDRVFREAGLLKPGESLAEGSDGKAQIDFKHGRAMVVGGDPNPRFIPREDWPKDAEASNVELLGFNLLDKHPGTIEIAGVILLMAMLGAVVLSRKQVEIDEEAKRAQSGRLGSDA